MRIFTMTALFLSALLFAGCALGNAMLVKGNGNIITTERTISSFEKIHASGKVDVRFHVSKEARITVTVDSNLDKYTKIETNGNELWIGTKNGNYSFTEYTVDVYYPALIGISVSGSGSFSCSDEITASSFDTEVSGSGQIKGNIHCENFSSKISGSGEIFVSGDADDLSVTISGSGDFDGKNFSVKNVSARISGSGSADIKVSDHLDADISGSGNLYYSGNPTVESEISGSGKIVKK